jgi:hypothetical protein
VSKLQPCGHDYSKLDTGCMACIDEFQASQAKIIMWLNAKLTKDSLVKDKGMKKKTGPVVLASDCLWCKGVFVEYSEGTLEEAMRRHVLKDCAKHPMRKLERKIARLTPKKGDVTPKRGR